MRELQTNLGYFNDIKSLFQPKYFHESVILFSSCKTEKYGSSVVDVTMPCTPHADGSLAIRQGLQSSTFPVTNVQNCYLTTWVASLAVL